MVCEGSGGLFWVWIRPIGSTLDLLSHLANAGPIGGGRRQCKINVSAPPVERCITRALVLTWILQVAHGHLSGVTVSGSRTHGHILGPVGEEKDRILTLEVNRQLIFSQEQCDPGAGTRCQWPPTVVTINLL